MLTNYFGKQKSARVALALGAMLLLFTGCNLGNQSNTSPSVQPTSSTVTSASAIIRHSPSGIALLQWDHTSHAVSLQLSLTGLAPKSSHPVQIVEGSCKNPGRLLYNLSNLHATPIGFANFKETIKGVPGGIPETGWSVNVSDGPGATAASETASIVCANVFNPTISMKTNQTVQATLLNAFTPNQNVTGTANLSIQNKQLTVMLSLKGLAPRSKHLAHIHYGSCASQGSVVHDLNSIVADASGDTSTTTVIPGVSSIPRNGWYITVHLAGTEGAMKSQTSNDPIACGDIAKIS